TSIVSPGGTVTETSDGEHARPGTGAGDADRNRAVAGGASAPGDEGCRGGSVFRRPPFGDGQSGSGHAGGVQPPTVAGESGGRQLDRPQARKHQEPAADNGHGGPNGRAGSL